MNNRFVEALVGLFLIFAAIAFTVLALKVSGLTTLFPVKSYTVIAAFDDIGGLKVRAPVKISGVQIGKVAQIDLDPKTFKAIVKLEIEDHFNEIPADSSAGILTAGLLGDNYISITPMYSETFLKDKSEIEITQSAMILEKLIGQLIYKLGNNEKSTDTSTDTSTDKSTDTSTTEKPISTGGKHEAS